MKPRNDDEREVLKLSALLPALNERQEMWAIMHATDKYPKDTHRFDDYIYFPTTIKGWQVLRMFYVNRKEFTRDSLYHNKGEVQGYTEEVLQKWIKPDKPLKIITLGVSLKMCPNYHRNPFASWTYSYETHPNDKEKYRLYKNYMNPMSVKIRRYNPNSYSGCWYHDWKDVPCYTKGVWLKELGVVKDSLKAGCSIDWWEETMNTYAETLLKLGRFDLVKFVIDKGGRYGGVSKESLLSAIKMVMRNGGFPDKFDWQLWCDHLKTLKDLGMDLHNPKVLMPDNLLETHNMLVKRLENKRVAEELKRQRELAKKHEARVWKRSKPFLQFSLDADGLHITPLFHASEYVEEGARMHHCVGLYYPQRDDALILSAKDDEGNRVETIRISLKDFTIAESRGLLNRPSPRHEEIIALMESGLPTLKKMQSKAMREAKRESKKAVATAS